jgi:hypothetical protein
VALVVVPLALVGLIGWTCCRSVFNLRKTVAAPEPEAEQ